MLIDLPKIGPTNFADNLTQDQFDAQLESLSKQHGFEIPKGELTYGEQAGRALHRGIEQTKSTFGDIIPAMVGSALGYDEYAKEQMAEAKQTQDLIAAKYAPQYGSLSDVKGIADIPGFVLENFVENVPNLLTSLIPGVGVEAVATRVAAGKVAAQLTAEAAAKGLAENEAASFIQQGLLKSLPQIKAAGQMGQHVGVYLGSYAQNAPEVFQNIYDKTGELAPGAGMLWGSASAALDSVLPTKLLQSVSGPVKVGIVEKLLEKSGMEKGLVRSIAANVLKDMGYEGLTEGAQEAISESAEKFVGNHPQVFDSKDWERIVESSVRGAVSAGPLGIGAGTSEHLKNRPEYQPAFDEAKTTNKPVRLPIETQGEGVFYVYPNGDIAVDKAAMKEKTKQEKIDANLARQKEQKDKAEFKEAQERLKKAIEEIAPSKPFNIVDLAKGVQTAPGASDLQKTIAQAKADTEGLGPRVVKKPIKATPQDVAPKIDDSTFKALGIGPTATFVRNKLIHGKDISNPTDAAEVKTVLEAYAKGTKSEPAKAKVAEYLSRPEFQAIPQETQNEPIAGASEPSVPSTEQAVLPSGPTPSTAEPVNTGVGVSGEPNAQPVTGEPAVSTPLGAKETRDLAKAEAAVEPAITEQQAHADENDARTLDLMKKDIPAGEDNTGLEDTPAFKYLRLPNLLQEYFRLKEVGSKTTEPKQRVKNAKQLAVVREAIAKSGKEAAQILKNLEENPQHLEEFLQAANREGRELHAAEVKRRVEESKAAKEKSAAETKEAETTAKEAALDEVANDILKAIDSGKFANFVEAALGKSTDPQDRLIIDKVKKMGLRTKVVVGKVVRNKGIAAENDAGVYDPATDTITLDSDFGLSSHTAMHELVHAAISHVLRDPTHPLTKQLTAIYKGVYSQLGSSYGAQDLQEFAAELVSNPAFKEALKGIKAPKGGNMLQRIIQHIAEFFGFRKGTSAYEEGIKTINKILDIAKDTGPTEGEMLFNVVTDMRDAMPMLGKKAVEDTKNYFSNIQGAGLKSLGMGLLRLDHINKIWGNQLPSVQKLLDSLEMRKGYQEAAIKRVKNNYSQFLKVVRDNPTAVKRMEDMAYDARLGGVDPANPNFKTTPSNAAEYKRLRDIHNALPQDVRQMYDTIRNDYKKAFDDYKDFLINSTDSPSLKQKIKAQFEANSDVVAYIPFLRRGDYWVEYTDKATGERAASAFESIRERQQFIDSQLKGEEHRTYQNIENAGFNPNAIPSTSFLGKVMGELSKKGATQQQLDSVYQSYLTLFPAHSISKQFMKSKNVRGMEQDIVRGYGDTMLKWSRKLANTIYAPQIDGALEEIREQAKAANDPSVTAAAKNILDQTSFMHNPTYSGLVHSATALSYFEYIAGNLSSALVNLTSLPLLVFPILGGKFGFAKTSSAMLDAHKAAADWVLKKNNTMGKYNALYKMLQDHGQLEHTQARELLEGRRTSTAQYTGLKARIEDGISMPFSATEKYNRAVTAIAAYNLAKNAGYSEDKALRLALDTVKDAHTSGMADTAPKWMQNPIGRVFFTFKSFAWNSAFIVAKSFHDAFKGESKEIRDAARRQLIGMYAMTGLFAGAKGLPFMGLAEVIGQMLHALFGDDDEPYDFNEDLRAFLGELLYKGPVNYATNLEISNRVGLAQDLVFRDDPRGIAENGYVLSAMKNAFGPAGSYMVNAEGAVKMFNEGHTERAIEALLPSWARNGMKGGRYMTEGALTLKGDPVDADVGAYNSLMQVIGFSPASLSSQYETTSVAKSYEKKIADRRQSLLNKYDMAHHGGDSDMMQEVREDIGNFNKAHPKDKIDGTTLQKSISARKAAEKNMINGVTFNKKLLPEIKEKFFEE
jgi:hypothetical protein